MLRGVDAAGKAVERMSERWGFDGVLERFAVGFESDSAESRGTGNGSGRKIGIGAPWKGKGPAIPVHVFLTLARVENGGLVGPWRIRRQEIVFQPMVSVTLCSFAVPCLFSLHPMKREKAEAHADQGNV